MSDTVDLKGWCYVCNTAIEADVQAHFDQEHAAVTGSKPKVPMLSWQHRARNVMSDLSDVLEDSDPGRQIRIIDGVLQELYLVRARLGQMKRQEGSQNGRS
jgi:hypothetical protein